MPVRIRTKVDQFHKSDHHWTQGSLVTPQIYILQSSKTVDSIGNPYHLLGRTDRDIGSSFAARGFTWDNGKQSLFVPQFKLSSAAKGSSDPNYRTYSGPIYPNYHNRLTLPTGLSVPNALNDANMNTYGTKGVSASIPTNPLVNIGQFAAELKEIPRLFDPRKWEVLVSEILRSPSWFKAKKAGRDAADDYLNYQFGWRPMIKDMKDFLFVTDGLEKRVKFLLNNSGKTTRRRRTLLEKTTTESPVTLSNSSYGAPVLHVNFYKNLGQLTSQITTTEKVWFSGGFTFLLQGDGTLGDPKTRAHIHKILNSPQLTPETLWNVAPWTWAVGWMSNTSQLARNYQAFSADGLVLRYGYIMRELSQTVTYHLKGLQFKNKIDGPEESSLTQFLNLTSKQRSKATPFGFGQNPDSFSPRQWSIIAALGISNLPRKL